MSLLLDALKKAALEKQRRDQGGIAPSNVVELSAKQTPQTTEPLSANHSTPQPEPNFIELIDAELDLSKTHLNNSNSSTTRSETFEQTIHTENQKPQEALFLEIDELALEPQTDAPEINANTTEIKPDTLDNSVVSKDNEAAENSNDNSATIDQQNLEQPLAAKAEIPSEKIAPTEIASAASSENNPTAKSDPIEAGQKENETTNSPKAPSESSTKTAYTDEQGKSAFAQLLGTSHSAAKIEKRKRAIFLFALACTAATVVGLYYFYLMQSSSDIPSHAAIPVSSETSEFVDENTENAEANLSGENTVPQNEIIETNENENDVIAKNTIENTEIANDPNSQIIESTIDNKPSIARATPNLDKNLEKPSTHPKPISSAEKSQPVQRRAPTPVVNKAEIDATPRIEIADEREILVERRPDNQNRVSNAVNRGYQAFQQGDISEAEFAYQEALRISPRHRDAILGAAAVAVRQGRTGDALRLYQQQLQADPRDTHARAGLLSVVVTEKQSAKLESELNVLLRENPEAAYLHFLKGTLYARRGEWPAAQNAFFNAWQRDSENPDYTFNLAVSLDQLGSHKQALTYYGDALKQSKIRGASFDIHRVANRIRTLEAVNP